MAILLPLTLVATTPSAGIGWGNPELLVRINDTHLTKQDYLDWWQVWKEPETPLPEAPDDFVDWMLLFREAEAMQLFDQPGYRQKVTVFLRARSLLLLKEEEVDSKIPAPSRDDLWALYAETYLPRVNLKLVSVDAAEKERLVAERLAAGAGFEAAADAAGLLDGPAFLAETGLMRPKRLPAPLLEAVREAAAGATGGPVSCADTTYFFEVLERDDGTEADFEALRPRLVDAWNRRQAGQLTGELMERLREKHQVKIDDALLARIGLDPLDEETAGLTVVRMGDIEASGQVLQDALLEAARMRFRQKDLPDEELDSLRQRVIADMLSQTLSSQEALDRHYEDREPFRKIYRFYCQNRMIKELEQALVQPQAQVTDADIEAAYRSRIGEFTREGTVEIALVQTREPRLARDVEARLLQGEDFGTAVAPVTPDGGKVKTVPADHLPQPVQEALSGLSPGQSSRLIELGDEFAFVRLIARGKNQVAPLEKVRDQLEKELAEQRFREVRANLLDRLRERSRIKVTGRAWKQVLAQLEEESHDNMDH